MPENKKKPRKEKDLIQKVLLDYEDVFADVVNVLLFHGQQVVKPEELVPADTAGIYRAGKQMRPLIRDAAKYWKKGKVTICLFGAENQNRIDETMLFRCMGYDGSSYRRQAGRKKKKYYPVITIVLYYGNQPWNLPKTLYETLEFPEDLKPYVNDYHLNLFDLMHMDEEEIKKFSSDFSIKTTDEESWDFNPDRNRLLFRHTG